MSGEGSAEVQIARLELRADNADRDIAEIKAQREKDLEQYNRDREKDKDEVSDVRRSLAWLMGAAVIVGAILSQLLAVGFTLIKVGFK